MSFRKLGFPDKESFPNFLKDSEHSYGKLAFQTFSCLWVFLFSSQEWKKLENKSLLDPPGLHLGPHYCDCDGY